MVEAARGSRHQEREHACAIQSATPESLTVCRSDRAGSFSETRTQVAIPHVLPRHLRPMLEVLAPVEAVVRTTTFPTPLADMNRIFWKGELLLAHHISRQRQPPCLAYGCPGHFAKTCKVPEDDLKT